MVGERMTCSACKCLINEDLQVLAIFQYKVRWLSFTIMICKLWILSSMTSHNGEDWHVPYLVFGGLDRIQIIDGFDSLNSCHKIEDID